MQPANVILALLKEQHLVPHAFLDEDAARVLLDDGLFVLQKGISESVICIMEV